MLERHFEIEGLGEDEMRGRGHGGGDECGGLAPGGDLLFGGEGRGGGGGGEGDGGRGEGVRVRGGRGVGCYGGGGGDAVAGVGERGLVGGVG